MEDGQARGKVNLKFSAGEILEAALWLEKAGTALYRLLSEEYEDEKLKGFFLRLMGMEMNHERRIREMLKTYPPPEPEKLGFDEDLTGREYFLRLREAAVARVYPDAFALFRVLDETLDPADALPIAIKAEENMVELYKRFMDFTLDNKAKETLSQMIADEKAHIAEVGRIYKTVTGKDVPRP